MIRNAYKLIQSFLTLHTKASGVLLLQGASQVGKTFLLQQVLNEHKKIIHINFEKNPEIKLEIDACKNFSDFTFYLKFKFEFRPDENFILCIDEAQESEKLGSFVRFMKEDWKATRTILMGSSMAKLFDNTTRVPVGRIEYLNLHPFYFSEFLRFLNKEHLLEILREERTTSDQLHNELLKFYDDYLLVGGMPEAVKAYAQSERKNHQDILRYIIASQREDFLRKESLKTNLFLDGLKGVANHIGQTSKFSHIFSNSYEAKKIITKLIEWFLVIEVDQKGIIPTQHFLPKRYLYDIGVLRLLRDTAIPNISVIHTTDEMLRTPLGGLIENAVLLELLQTQHGYHSITSWKKNNKENIEVDFILNTGHLTIPIEVKACLKATERHCKNIVHYLKTFKLETGYLISLDKKKEFIIDGKKIINLPAYSSNFTSIF